MVQVRDAWAALQLDNAVIYFGTVIENAAQEMEKRGPESSPRWEPKYTLAQLLTPGFALRGQEAESMSIVGADGLIVDEV